MSINGTNENNREDMMLKNLLQVCTEGNGDKIYLSNEEIGHIMTIIEQESDTHLNKNDRNVIIEILETNIKNNAEEAKTEKQLNEMNRQVQDVKWLKEADKLILPDVPINKPNKHRKVKERIKLKK